MARYHDDLVRHGINKKKNRFPLKIFRAEIKPKLGFFMGSDIRGILRSQRKSTFLKSIHDFREPKREPEHIQTEVNCF